MIAEKNQYMSEAAEEMYVRNADEIIREQCRVREENLAYERYVKEQLEQLSKLQQELAEKEQTIVAQQHVLSEKDQILQDAFNRIAELQEQLSNQ